MYNPSILPPKITWQTYSKQFNKYSFKPISSMETAKTFCVKYQKLIGFFFCGSKKLLLAIVAFILLSCEKIWKNWSENVEIWKLGKGSENIDIYVKCTRKKNSKKYLKCLKWSLPQFFPRMAGPKEH